MPGALRIFAGLQSQISEYCQCYSRIGRYTAIMCLLLVVTGCGHHRISIASPEPPTIPAATTTDGSINIAKPLPIAKTYTTSDYKTDLKGYSDAVQAVTIAPNDLNHLNVAKMYRNNIVWGEMSTIETVYTVYHSRLFSDKNMISVAGDAMTLGLTAASTIAGNKETKTILSALGTAFAGLGLSIDKNYFAQQSFPILGLAIQTRRDKVRAAIATKLNLCDVIVYPLEQGQRDLVQYFGAGTLDSALQELQEEAAASSSAASTTANNGTPSPQPTTTGPPGTCPIIPPPPAATPFFIPPAGLYSKPVSVTITSTPGATIYYTLDGKTPNTGSPQYADGKPIAITSTATLQAIATATGYSTSALGTAAYTIGQTAAATPTFNVPSGAYPSILNVTISSNTPNAIVYYTTDGTQPATSVTGTTKQYSGALTVSSSETINAIATADGYTNSAVASAVYTISLSAAAAPVLNPVSGTSSASSINVSITSNTPGAVIFYTTDGSVPATSVTGTTKQYSGPIPVSSSQTISAIAIASGLSASQITSATYTITGH